MKSRSPFADTFKYDITPILGGSAPSNRQASGRLPASEINKLAPSARETKLNQSAENAIIPIAYGEVPVNGKMIGFVEAGGYHYFLMMWCMGPIHSVKTLFINDSTDFSGITGLEIRHYLGSVFQAPDPWFVANVASYTDDLIVRKPAGLAGVAYTAIKIDSKWIDTNGIPAFQAIIKGRFCYDPDKSTYTDSYFDDVGLQVEFIGADSTAPTDLDESLTGHTLTYVGGATIQSNKLSLNGTTQYVTVPNHASLRPGGNPWSIEMTVAPSTIAAGDPDTILAMGNAFAGPPTRNGVFLARNGQALNVQIADAASGWGIVLESISGVFTAINTDVHIVVEFTGQSYLVLVDGVLEYSVNSTEVVFANVTDAVCIGSMYGAWPWQGTISNVRLTFGSYRYGSQQDTSLTGSPWLDSGAFQTGHVWTDNSALCTAELIESPIYGHGIDISNILGIKAGKDWDDELLGGAVPRSRLSLLISQPRKVQEHIAVLSTYAEVFTVLEGEGAAIIPDRPPVKEAPSGQQFIPYHTMDIDPSAYWTFSGVEWAYDDDPQGIRCTNSTGSDSTAEITLTELFIGEVYAVEVVVLSESATGDFSIGLDGVEIGAGTNPGSGNTETLIVEFTATATEHVLELIVANTGVLVWQKVSVRGLKWIETDIVKDSLKIKGVSNESTPTKVTITWREASDTTANWQEKSASYTLPEAASGDIPLVETTLSMTGITREEESLNKALSRALRLSDKTEYQWESLDPGIALRAGTVVRLYLPESGVDQDVMLRSAKMTKYGRYAIEAESFSVSHYPNELTAPEDTTTVFVDMIGILLPSSPVPDGWEWIGSLHQGKFIMAHDPDDAAYEIGDAVGSTNITGWSGSTSVGGAHTEGAGDGSFPIENWENPTGTPGVHRKPATNPAVEGHSHTYTVADFDPRVYARNVFLIKATAPALKVPAGVMLLGKAGLLLPEITRSTAWVGRLLRSSNTSGSSGLSQRFLTTEITVDNASFPSHSHVQAFSNVLWKEQIAQVQSWFPSTDTFLHNHGVSLEVIRNSRRMKMALYAASAEYNVIAGMRCFWLGAFGDIPDDWILCTGRLGTPNAVRCLIEVAALGEEDTIEGDNTYSISGELQGHTHSHDSGISQPGQYLVYASHRDYTHTHSISKSGTFLPASRVFGILQYTPRPDWGHSDLLLLLGGGEVDGGTTIVDHGPGTLVPEAENGMAYTNAWSQFEGTSINVVSASSYLEYDNLLGTSLYNGKWTIGVWIYADTLPATRWLMSTKRGAATAGKDYWELVVDSAGDLEFRYNGATGPASIEGAAKVSATTAGFLALQWDGTEFSLYYGDVSTKVANRIGQYTPTTPDLHGDLNLFSDHARANAFDGKFEEFYLLDGCAFFRDSTVSIPQQPPRS